MDPDAAERAAKAASRAEQGWSRRQPLSAVVCRHDGSTREERRGRLKRTETPWQPVERPKGKGRRIFLPRRHARG